MFATKLQSFFNNKISVIRKIHNNVNTSFFRKTQCNEVSWKKSQNIKKIISSKCKEYQDKLARCPRPFREFSCNKPLRQKSKPKCNVNVAAENYNKAYEDITNHAKLIVKTIQDESKSILDRFEDNINSAKNTEEARIEEFSHNINQKFEKLMTLDPLSASLKRKYALSLNYQIRDAFTKLRCDVVPKIERIKQNLKILEESVLICIDRAKSLILECRKSKDPQALIKCIEQNADFAKRVLEETFKSTQVKLREIEALQHETLQYHKTVAAEVTEIYRKRYKEFSKHLEECILIIKKQK